jgi:hypothetical protein
VLNTYLQEVRQIVGDKNVERYSEGDLRSYINRARRKVAGATQCIRVLPPSSGSFVSMAVGAGGTGYTTPPTVTISGPDASNGTYVQATATASVAGGAVTGFTVTNAGTGYVASPTVTIGGPGTGASAVVTLTPFVSVNPGQEVYQFQLINPIIASNFPGVGSIIAVQDIAVSWGSWKPMMRNMPAWSAFQAYCRAWNLGQENYPTVWSQFGQGENGSVYVFPIPSVIAQMDWDCYCMPIPLVDDTTVEAIPHPFTEAVPYYAAYLAYLNAQQQDMAEHMWTNYRRQMAEARSYSTPSMVVDYYPADP